MNTQDLQTTLERLESLPTLPTVLTQVLATVNDPDTSALDLGRLIAADQSLSAAVLRMVNSAYYSYYRQIDTVTQAIVILGFNEVCKVALAATAFKAVPASDSGYDRRQLWRHSLASGMAAERAARAAGWPPAGGYFIAGLLNDIGKVALDWLWPDEFAQAVVTAHGTQRPLPEVEREIFGADHCVVGAALATHWNLPENVVESIRCHFEPESARKDPALVHLAVMADYLAFTADAGDSAESFGPQLPTKSQAAVGVTDSQVGQIIEYIVASEERIEAFLGSVS